MNDQSTTVEVEGVEIHIRYTWVDADWCESGQRIPAHVDDGWTAHIGEDSQNIAPLLVDWVDEIEAQIAAQHGNTLEDAA